MAQIGSAVLRRMGAILRADTGLKFTVEQVAASEGIQPAEFPVARVEERNVAAAVLEKKAGAQYPSVFLYCDRVENTLREKFRTFSGQARMVAEIRVTHDHLEGLENAMRLYSDAFTQVLDFNRGDLGGGMFFGGGYVVEFMPAAEGGKHYIQTARVTFSIEVSLN